MNPQNSTGHRAYLDEVSTDLESNLLAGLEFINWDKYINKKAGGNQQLR